MPHRSKSERRPAKRLDSQSALNGAVLGICDVMRRSNCAGALQYVPEITWILFLRILDVREEQEAERAEAVGSTFRPSLKAPYRWRDWAAPGAPRRKHLQESGTNAFYDCVNSDLIPHLKALKDQPRATSRQKVISEIMSGVDRTRIDTERNLCDVLDKVHEISPEHIDPTHVFTLSQIYEGLLLKMGEKGNDGGQFFTPREIEARAQQVEDAAFDLKAVNPNSKSTEDTRSSAEILTAVECRGREVEEVLGRLRRLMDTR